MFNHGPFFFQLLRKYETYFAYCFSNLTIQRFNGEEEMQRIVVPLQWASKNKQLVRVDTDPKLQKDTSLTVPRMSYIYTDLTYDGTRKLGSTNQTVSLDTSNANQMKTQFTPVPYDITFKLFVYVNQIEDGTRIMEQILPFFTPDFTATLDLIPEMSEQRDIPIILNSVDIEDVYAGDMLVNRAIIYTLNFTMKAYFWCPVVPKPIIKFAFENFKTGANDAYIETITVEPGMDANGDPTTLLANSVPVSNIYATNNYGYVVFANGMMKSSGN